MFPAEEIHERATGAATSDRTEIITKEKER